MKMEYQFIQALETAIEDCVNTGRGKYELGEQRWIEAVWEEVKKGSYLVKVYLFEKGLPVFCVDMKETLTTEG